MKKVIVIALALALAMAFAMPAMAGGPIVKFGTKILADFGYYQKSKELTTNGTDDVTTFFGNLPGHTRLNFRFLSPDKSTGAFVEFGLKSLQGSATTSLRYAYGWYTVGNCTFIAGHLSNWFGSAAYSPLAGQATGLNEGAHLYLFGWGHLWGQRLPQVAFKWENGPWGVYVALEEPQNRSLGFASGTDTYEYFPRFTIAGKYRTKLFDTMPAFNITSHQAEGTASGADDQFYTWAVVLPWKIGIGAFTILGQFHYGVNFNNEYLFYPADSGVYTKTDGKFEDTITWGGHLGVTYKIGAVTLAAGFGYEKFQNDEWKTDAGYKDDNYDRKAYYIAAPYAVNKYFVINPSFSYYDHGDSYKTGDDNGTEWILGVEFQFSF